MIAHQHDNGSATLTVSGDIPDGWDWDMLVQAGGDLNITRLQPMKTGIGVILTDDMLAKAGTYTMQLRGTFQKDGTTAVSYTHLDVYKRQEQAHQVFGDLQIVLHQEYSFHGSPVLLCVPEGAPKLRIVGFIGTAVSYTHLLSAGAPVYGGVSGSVLSTQVMPTVRPRSGTDCPFTFGKTDTSSEALANRSGSWRTSSAWPVASSILATASNRACSPVYSPAGNPSSWRICR